jgi:hypothetical protein
VSVLRRIFRIKAPQAVIDDARAGDISKSYDTHIEAARQDMRQALQKLESGARVMRTIEGAMTLAARGNASG